MDISAHTPAPLDLTPVPAAATLWLDTPLLYERLRARLSSYAPNTQRALAADWKRWRTWCANAARAPFPAAPPDIVEYLLAHSPPLEIDSTGAVAINRDATGAGIRRASTTQRWLASLATLHRIADAPDPTRHEDVKAAKRTVRRGRNAPEQKAPLRWPDVLKALDTLGRSLRDLRARALIAVAYSTLARRAELVDIRLEDVTFGDTDDGSITLRTKGGDVSERYLASEARRALEAWLDEAQIYDGFVFRRLERHGSIGERAISAEEVARTFKRIAGTLNLDPSRPLARISGHSTRIGAAQDLTAAGAALPEIMIAGGWKSPQMPTHYARKLDIQQGAMRRWTESARKRD